MPGRSTCATQSGPCATPRSGSTPRLGAPGSLSRFSGRLSTSAVTPDEIPVAHQVPPAARSRPPTTSGVLTPPPVRVVERARGQLVAQGEYLGRAAPRTSERPLCTQPHHPGTGEGPASLPVGEGRRAVFRVLLGGGPADAAAVRIEGRDQARFWFRKGVLRLNSRAATVAGPGTFADGAGNRGTPHRRLENRFRRADDFRCIARP